MNPFESGQRKVIPAVLVYARHGDRVLMLHRNAGGARGAADYHSGKWNGLGGKAELDESPLETARREFHEEAGVLLEESAFIPIGTLLFPNFKPKKNEDWFVTVWIARITDLEAPRLPGVCAEGERHWIPCADLLKLNLWSGDQHFIPYVLEERPFLGTIWYQGENVVRNEILDLTHH